MRDWQKDWELSQRATPEPWEMIILGPYENPPCGLGTFVANCGSTASFKEVLVVSLGCSSSLDVKGAVEDAQFITEAREALPYWLQRVQDLEAQCAGQREALEYADLCIRREWDEIESIPQVAKALSSDAGRDLLERLRKLEAVAEASKELCASIYNVNTYARIENLAKLREALEALEGGDT